MPEFAAPPPAVPPTPDGPMLEVRGLVKEFRDLRRGRVRAVDDVGFEVRGGEIFGLLGPNGAGKTTTLRILSTVLEPTAGVARVAGYDVRDSPGEVRRSIGFMSNNTGIYERMTALEMVQFFGRLHGFSDAELAPRVERIFDDLQMNDFRDTLGSKLSTGMTQKVSIARTIIHDPPVLIFDEPTTGLDVLVARAVLKTIERLRDDGKCVIFSTHIMSEVEKLCDRIAVIHRGRILADGSVDDLRTQTGEPDVEEAFFHLIEAEDGRAAADAPAAAEAVA